MTKANLLVRCFQMNPRELPGLILVICADLFLQPYSSIDVDLRMVEKHLNEAHPSSLFRLNGLIESKALPAYC